MIAIAQLQDKRAEWTDGPRGAEATSQKLAANYDASITGFKQKALELGQIVGFNGENIDRMVDPGTGQPWTNEQKQRARSLLQTFGPQGVGGGGTLAPLTLQEMVDRRLSGDKSVVANIGRGTQGGQNIAAFNNALGSEMQRRGITGEQLARIDQEFIARQRGMSSEEGAVGQRAGAIALAVQEADDTLPNVRRLAQISAGRGYATWDAVESKWKVQKGDKNFATYTQQLNTLVNIYGRFVSGGGKGAVYDREHAREMLNPNMPLSAAEGSLDGFEAEIGIGQAAPGKVRARMHGESAALPPRDTTLPKDTTSGGKELHYDSQGNLVQ
jgi:hypothetical protein